MCKGDRLPPMLCTETVPLNCNLKTMIRQAHGKIEVMN